MAENCSTSSDAPKALGANSAPGESSRAKCWDAGADEVLDGGRCGVDGSGWCWAPGR